MSKRAPRIRNSGGFHAICSNPLRVCNLSRAYPNPSSPLLLSSVPLVEMIMVCFNLKNEHVW